MIKRFAMYSLIRWLAAVEEIGRRRWDDEPVPRTLKARAALWSAVSYVVWKVIEHWSRTTIAIMWHTRRDWRDWLPGRASVED